ncbi:hypothetical protein F6455_14345 [Proteobacteria bacterium 005FR1]|nr:hypothetical protein [Proteobacteria bacterium 005FR1]
MLSTNRPTPKKHMTTSLALLAGLLAAGVGSSAFSAPPVEEKPDGSWVSVKGTVSEKLEMGFKLDYGEGSIVVETDDWDADNDAALIEANDEVTVYGAVDDDFYHSRTIEAESVYVEDLSTVLTGPSLQDEEQVLSNLDVYYAPAEFDFVVAGKVTGKEGRTFTVDTGPRKIEVDTSAMPNNPLDDSGRQQIDEGDFVSVSGNLVLDVFEKRKVLAERVVSLD